MFDDAVLTLESSLDPAAAADAILAAAAAEQYGVLGDIDIHATLNQKGFPFPHPVRVIEVCSPAHAAQVLEAELEISTALPCRISVFVRDGVTCVSTIKPSLLLMMFAQPQLAPVAAEVEQAIVRIMQAATGSQAHAEA